MTLDRTDPTAEALASAVEGQFRLEKEIGRGGMGVVYLAVEEQLARHVAIKTLPPHLNADASVRERFLREGRTAGALSHPGIVPIYTAAERNGVVYFVMRWIDGESLADRLAAHGPMSSDAVCALLAELTHALEYAHAHGIVHRDIKAENILIERKTGRAVITDFGIARVAETQPMTATGTVLGTVQYMSPEQVTGDAIDGRSDLYALGVLAYHALTCRYPFERPMPSAVLVAHVNSPPPRVSWLVPGVSPKLERVINRLLEKNPAARFASAELLRNALETKGEDDGAQGAALSRQPSARSLVGTPGAVAPRVAQPQLPERLSSTEAQAVWARAAELQANTGLLVRPANFPTHRESGAGETRGYDMSIIRESAVDAGIDIRYVDRALVERAQAPLAVARGESMQAAPGMFVGAPTRIQYEGFVDGELTPDGFEELADLARRTLGEMVQVSLVGRTLTVTSASAAPSFKPFGMAGAARSSGTPRLVQLTITSRNGRTSVYGLEDLQQLSHATFGGVMGGIGMGGGGMLLGASMGVLHNPVMGVTLWLSTIVGSYFGARMLFGHKSRQREEELRKLVERMLAMARDFVR